LEALAFTITRLRQENCGTPPQGSMQLAFTNPRELGAVGGVEKVLCGFGAEGVFTGFIEP